MKTKKDYLPKTTGGGIACIIGNWKSWIQKKKIMEEQKIQQLNRFKIEKENAIQYPIKELLKDSINDWILSDIQQINMKLGQELRLISKVNNKDDIKRLKCFVKNNKSNLGPMLYDE